MCCCRAVLIDENKRAIYDTLGARGLETDGWQLVERNKTAQEIREEYERLVKLKEDQRLQQRTNPKGTIIIGVNATDVFEHEDDDDYESEGILPAIEVSSMNITQSIEMPLTSANTATISGNLSSQNGRGQGQSTHNCAHSGHFSPFAGQFVSSLRHIVSPKTWVELQFVVGQGRSQQVISHKLDAD